MGRDDFERQGAPKEEKVADPKDLAERVGIAYDTAAVRRFVSKSDTGKGDLSTQDWYRNRDPYFGGEIEINGQPIQEFSSPASHPEYAEFQTKEGLKKFFREACLKNFTGTDENKEQAVDYLYDTFNQKNYMRPLEQSLTFVAASRLFTPLASTRSSLLSINSTANGVSITESIRYDGISTVTPDHPLRPLAFLNHLAPEKKGAHLIEASSTLEIDFSKNASEPQLRSINNEISFGHSALEAFILTGSINDYLMQGHLNAYQELQTEVKFSDSKAEIVEVINSFVKHMYNSIGKLLSEKEKDQDRIIELGRKINDLLVQVQRATHPQSLIDMDVLKHLQETVKTLAADGILPANNVEKFIKYLDGFHIEKPEAKSAFVEAPVVRFHEGPKAPTAEKGRVQWHEHKETSSHPPEEPRMQYMSDHAEDVPAMSSSDFLAEAERERKIARDHAMDTFIATNFELPKEKEVLYVELQYRLHQLKAKAYPKDPNGIPKVPPEDELMKKLYEQAQEVIRANGEKVALEPLENEFAELGKEINRAKHHRGLKMFSGNDPVTFTHQGSTITLQNKDALKALEEALQPIQEVINEFGEKPSVTLHF